MMTFSSVLSDLEEKGEIVSEEWQDFDAQELYKVAARENIPWKRVHSYLFLFLFLFLFKIVYLN